MFRLVQRIAYIIGTLLVAQQRYDNPTSTLPDGFEAGPNIRQSRLGRSWRSGDFGWKERPSPFVTTKLGTYEGYFMKVISGREVYAFEGIPYAEIPKRFRAPKPKAPFEGIFSAKSFGHDCVQTYAVTITLQKPRLIIGNEDCLTCNIYTPEIKHGNNDPKLPIIMNIYGGSFLAGSSRDYGPSYLLEQDVILVSCNYRLSVLGFLSTGDKVAPGNWGLKDLALAVNWVYENIQDFGGDPNRITLLGQSAGAVMAHLLTMSSGAKEKIAGLIALSGNAFVPWAVMDPKLAIRMTRRFALMNLCPINQGSLAMVNCLRKRDSYVLGTLQNLVQITELSIFQFTPVVEPDVEGALITKTPEEIYSLDLVQKVPAIFSVTSKDVDLFHMLFTRLGVLPRRMKLTTNLSPLYLGYREKVANPREVVTKIVEFYGGKEALQGDTHMWFQAVQDRMFRNGMWKSIRLHSKIAPTYAQTFAYHSSNINIARVIDTNSLDYDVPHSEDLLYIFNRTDVPPISRNDDDFEIVKLLQTELTNFASTGKPKYTTDDFQDIEITEPANPKTETFRMLVIDRELKSIEMPYETNATKFWDSLNINEFPSLKK